MTETRFVDLGTVGDVRVGRLVVGPLEENCYVVAPTRGGDAIVIDPGDEADRILAAARGWGLTPRIVANTHGHMDHIGANAALVAAGHGVDIAIHADDAPMLTDPAQNLSTFLPPDVRSPAATLLLVDGEDLVVGSVRLAVMHTPGHTRGGTSFLLRANGDAVLFSGDTLFRGSVGRVDLPGGSWPALAASIVDRLLPLGDAVRVLPGHMDATTIGEERRANPFVREFTEERDRE